jgi:uncharacterized membrane protein YbhN (UPF0104 family)
VTAAPLRAWRRAAGLALGVALLAYLVSRQDLAATLAALSRLDARLLALPAVATLAGAALRAWRWRAMFAAPSRPGFGACFRALALGNLANNVLFGRAGDVLRCGVLYREHAAVRLSGVAAAVGLEKVLDGVALVLVVAAACALLSPPQWVDALAVAAAALFGAGLAVLGAVQWRGPRLLALARGIAGRGRAAPMVARAERLLEGLATGLGAIGSPARVGQVAGQTAAVWAADACVVWALALALGAPLPAAAACAVSAIVGLGLAVPAAPGAIGTYEFFAVGSLQLFDVTPATALALALLMHAWALGSTTAIGLAVLAERGLGWPGSVRISPPEGAAR